MATEKENNAARLHLELMHEARIRTEIVSHAFKNEAGFPPQMVREICYLQFRLLCETIALCCLVAHGIESRRLRDTYEANKIINELSKLNPEFFPVPMVTGTNGNATTMGQRPADQPALTKADLIKLWGLSGDVLHRAPLSKLEKPRKTDPADFSDVLDWSAKLAGLLSCYLIKLTETKAMLVSAKHVETDKPLIEILDANLETNTMNVERFRAV
ncbi:MAG: hypothetical protein WDO72_14370 [Pseudomonadota bacterium]